MKIIEYIERLDEVERFEKEFEKEQVAPENYKLVFGVDEFGTYDERRVRISYGKLPLGGSNLREHRNEDFEVEQMLITQEKRRLGI